MTKDFTEEEKQIVKSLEIFTDKKLIGIAFAILCSHLHRKVEPEKRMEMLFDLNTIILQAVKEEEGREEIEESRH